NRNHNEVILISKTIGSSFWQNTNHLEAHLIDFDKFANGVLPTEDFSYDRCTHHCHSRTFFIFIFRKKSSHVWCGSMHASVSGSSAHYLSVPVFVPKRHLSPAVHARCDIFDVSQLLFNGHAILISQSSGGTNTEHGT